MMITDSGLLFWATLYMMTQSIGWPPLLWVWCSCPPCSLSHSLYSSVFQPFY